MELKLLGDSCPMLSATERAALSTYLNSVPEEKRMAKALWLVAQFPSLRSTPPSMKFSAAVAFTRMEQWLLT
jgi:hypothetical protein